MKGKATKVKAVKEVIPDVQILAADGKSEPYKLIPVGRSIKLRAVPRKGLKGTYAWNTTSDKIDLKDDDKATVTVKALNNPSLSEDAEDVQLTFTHDEGAKFIVTSAKITVIKVTFSKSDNKALTYGYDDMDLEPGVAHHVSMKKNASTLVHVEIEGGIDSKNVYFVSADSSVAQADQPDPPARKFDLVINGKSKNKAETAIRARANRTKGPVCAEIRVNVYKEKTFKAVVAKVYDSTSVDSTLTDPAFDVEEAEKKMNEFYRPAVCSIDLTDYSEDGDAVDINYDRNTNGTLDLEPGTTSVEMKALTKGIKGKGTKIAIVKGLSWIYYLAKPAKSGDTKVTLKSSYSANMEHIMPNDTFTLGNGPNPDWITIKSKSGTTVTLNSALAYNHTTAEGINWPLGGLSTNPIVVIEADTITTRRAMGHETGHLLLNWRDLKAADNLMYFSLGMTDTRVRFKPQSWHYKTGDDNQWNKVKR